MSIIFSCKTVEAYQIKVLAELLSNNLKQGCFDVTEQGISLRMSDAPRLTLVDLVLYSENFNMYKLLVQDKLCLGLNLSHLHKVLKSIKKKDSLQLYIDSCYPNDLCIKTIPKENTRVVTSTVTIQNIQYAISDLPTGYGKPVNITSADFQKMSKELSSIGSSKIKVYTHQFYVEFVADADGIMKRAVKMGETDESENERDESSKPMEFATFTTDQITRISKITGLSNFIQIYTGSRKLPFLFRTNVGNLGKISIYMKSEEMQEQEAVEITDSDSESESS